jgi:acyl-CoA thioester hydrolase
MEHKKKLIHVTRMPIRWGDMDAYGHVNNTVYFRYMEQARVEWLEEHEDRGSSGRPGSGHHQCQLHLPDSDELSGDGRGATFAGHPGRSSVQTYVEMRIEGDETLYAEGAAKVVWMDTQTGKSAPIPDHVRASLETE